MKLIDPLEVTDAAFNDAASTVIPEDPGTQWTAGTYNLGDEVWKATTHRRYEVVEDPSTTDDPEVGVLADPPTWIDLGATNRWAMFDQINDNPTTFAGDIVFELTPGQVVNEIALLETEGTEANVTATSVSAGGEFYNVTKDLLSTENVIDGYTYCFNPFELVPDVIFQDIPPYSDAVFTITVSTTGTAKVGEFVYGTSFDLGQALIGARPGFESFSTVNTSTFGQTTITKRGFRKLLTIDTVVETSNINPISRKISELLDVPVVWVGDPDNSSLIVYGILGNYTPSFGVKGSKSFINFEIKGLR